MSCAGLISELTGWLANTTEAVPANMRRVVQFILTSNQRNDEVGPPPTRSNNIDAQFIGVNVVTFGIGNLVGVPPFVGPGGPTTALPVGGIPQLRGVGSLLFSDRTDSGGRRGLFQGRSDRIGLTINYPGRATIVLMDWGNATLSFDLQCLGNDVMFGLGDSVGNQSRPALYTISLAKQFIPQ